MSMKGFVDAAKTGVVTVEFTKASTGELRVMPCTLNHKLSEGHVPEILDQTVDMDRGYLAVWCVDKKGWRSFRLDSVQRWYVGYPEIVDE